MQKVVEEEQDFNPEVKTEIRKWTRHFGNNYVCFMIKGEPLLTLGPHWYMNICMFVTFFTSSLAFLYYVAKHRHIYLFYASLLISGLQIGSYLLCALINPGIVSAQREPPDKDMLACEVCWTTSQKEFTYHCEDCDVCIEGYDHHCPWTGKCIGKRNLYYFYCFILMIPLNIAYILIVVLSQ